MGLHSHMYPQHFHNKKVKMNLKLQRKLLEFEKAIQIEKANLIKHT